MIKEINIPIGWKLPGDIARAKEQNGTLEQYNQQIAEKNAAAKAELNSAMNDGYQIIYSGHVEDGRGTYTSFILYKPDPQPATEGDDEAYLGKITLEKIRKYKASDRTRWFVVLLNANGTIKDLPLLESVIPFDSFEEAMLRQRSEEHAGQLPILISGLAWSLIKKRNSE